MSLDNDKAVLFYIMAYRNEVLSTYLHMIPLRFILQFFDIIFIPPFIISV